MCFMLKVGNDGLHSSEIRLSSLHSVEILLSKPHMRLVLQKYACPGQRGIQGALVTSQNFVKTNDFMNFSFKDFLLTRDFRVKLSVNTGFLS